MICLSRKIGQRILVGDVPVMVLGIKGSTVRLGVDAPKDLPVDREEVRRSKQASFLPHPATQLNPGRPMS